MKKDRTMELDEEFLPAWAQGPFASSMAHRSAVASYLAEARTSSNPRQRLFATLTPWIRARIKRYQGVWDRRTQVPGEDCAQTFQQLLWESIVEWDRDKSNSVAFRANPTGVVIQKTRAKIRQWYQQERKRHWIERAIMQDVSDDWMSLDEYIGGWKKEAKQASVLRDRRYAEEVVHILSTIGDASIPEVERKSKDLIRWVRAAVRKAEMPRLRVALRCGVLNENDFALLTSKRIDAPDPKVHARLRKRQSRARQRFYAWITTSEGFTALAREGLTPTLEKRCWFIFAMSNPYRRIPKEAIAKEKQALLALPGGAAAWERFVAEGHFDYYDWIDFDEGFDGTPTWGDLGFPEADTDDD